MDQERKREFTRRISQANPTGLVVILYDMALAYLEEGRQALEQGDALAFGRSLDRALACISQLISSLRMEYAPAGELLSLYRYCVRILGQARRSMEAKRLEEVEAVLAPLRQAYAQLESQNLDRAVMGNRQEVYAGLTYGPGHLVEGTRADSGQRGFFV